MQGVLHAIEALVCYFQPEWTPVRMVAPAFSGGQLARAKRILAIDSRKRGNLADWYLPGNWQERLKRAGIAFSPNGAQGLRVVDELAFIETFKRYQGRFKKRQTERKAEHEARAVHQGLTRAVNGWIG
jgi:hypothetical protein